MDNSPGRETVDSSQPWPLIHCRCTLVLSPVLEQALQGLPVQVSEQVKFPH